MGCMRVLLQTTTLPKYCSWQEGGWLCAALGQAAKPSFLCAMGLHKGSAVGHPKGMVSIHCSTSSWGKIQSINKGRTLELGLVHRLDEVSWWTSSLPSVGTGRNLSAKRLPKASAFFSLVHRLKRKQSLLQSVFI